MRGFGIELGVMKDLVLGVMKDSVLGVMKDLVLSWGNEGFGNVLG